MIEASTPIIALTEWPTNTASLQAELAADLDDVVGISVERCILRRVVGGEIGLPGADMVEQHGPEIRLEGRRDEAPHVLIAAEAMGEDHRRLARPSHLDVVSLQNVT